MLVFRAQRHHGGFPSWSWLNYRYAKVKDTDEDLRTPAMLPCYRSVSDLSVPRAEGVLCLQPVSDETQCPSYLTHLAITPEPALLEVKEDDIPPATRECIKPNYNIIHWGSTIRVRWRRPTAMATATYTSAMETAWISMQASLRSGQQQENKTRARN